ncbi:MAG: ABC transporter ATP-binding protein [Treponema sp.]|nr:ABC transporter ATP-binding protein [Treponema sp.]
MLELNNLHSGYGSGDVLRNISLKAAAGEFLSVTGPNGCGKSTLLKAIARLLPYQGTITINNKDINSLSQKELAKNIALLGQISPLHFPYTVYDTIAMGRYAHSKGWFGNLDKTDKTAIENALGTLNLNELKNELISELSGGQFQRVFLARTLAQDPKIILLDEPTNHLDIKNQITLLDHLATWVKEEERVIIAVFHDLNLALRYSSSAFLMAEGTIAAQGSAAEVFSEYSA